MVTIDEVKILINKAQDYYLYSGEEEKKYLEAFLIQAAVLEGLTKRIAILSLKNKLTGGETMVRKREEQDYHFSTAIDDLFFTGTVVEDEFKRLDSYRRHRNKYIHELLEQNREALWPKLKSDYDDVQPVLNDLLKKIGKLHQV